MLSQISRRRFESERAKLISELEGSINERIISAKEKGDLRENSEYESAISDANRARIRISEIDEILSNSQEVPVYGSTIGIGSLVSIVYKLEDGTRMDLGLHLFDSVGSSNNHIVSPKSELGHRIYGTTGGKFVIRVDGGKTATVFVTLESESKIREYMEMHPIESENFSSMLD